MANKLRRFVADIPIMRLLLKPIWRLSKSIGWFIRSTLLKNVPLTIRCGSQAFKLYPAGQIPELIWHSDFEEGEREFIFRYIQPGMCVVNIGANVGLYTLMASTLVGPSGKVYAFEPSSITFERLRRNIEVNGARHVIAERVALSDQPGKVLLRSDRGHPLLDGHRFVDFSACRATVASPGDEWVDCTTLDAAFLNHSRSAQLRPLDLIIIDVEGSELAVLRGAATMLAQSPNLTILIECSQNRSEVGKLLENYGMEFFLWEQWAGRLQPCSFVEQASVGTVIAQRPRSSMKATILA